MAKEVRVFYSLFLNILFFLTFFVRLGFLFFFLFCKKIKKKKEETPKREKNREALSLVIITYRDILFLYDGFTLIPSFSIFLFLFFKSRRLKKKRKPVKGKNREKFDVITILIIKH
jgi:hypothetical protein